MSRKLLIICMLVAFAAAAALIGCSDAREPLAPVYKTKIAKNELRNSAFKDEFPQQYETYLRNNDSDSRTAFKADYAFRKNDNVNEPKKGFDKAQPYLKNLWLGYPFSWEYNEARGHTYAIHDILEIDRINQYGEAAGLPATCWNCKTAKIPSWVEENGDAFWAMNFNQFRTADKVSMDDNTIGCANCHNPENMELIINSVPLAETLERLGTPWQNATRNEMRTLVCAQCHVEYYFQEAEYVKDGQKVKGVNKKPVFPWDNGMDPDQIYEYYNEHGAVTMPGFEGKFQDWLHPVSKTPMIKVQHPEYETFSNGPHGAAGVSCADCHMPYVRMDGKKKVSNHQWTSPLKSAQGIDNACRQCHSDKSADYLRSRVEYTQQKTYDNLLAAQAMSVKAHEAVRQANEWTGSKHPQYDQLIIQAKEMVRKGQFFWDYLSAENSVGFHNPQKALDTAMKSLEYSNQAVQYAMQATNYGIAPNLEGDIHDVVPPILEWSREMQMDQRNLDSHVWTRYLPLQPKAERMWDLQTKIR